MHKLLQSTSSNQTSVNFSKLYFGRYRNDFDFKTLFIYRIIVGKSSMLNIQSDVSVVTTFKETLSHLKMAAHVNILSALNSNF